MRDFVKMIAELFVVCGLAAASLAVVNMVTKEPIARWEKAREKTALRAIVAGADEFKELTAGQVWEVRRNGRRAGFAFLTQIQGYSGPITLMFGADADGAVTGLQILSHTETPGLGAKIITALFRDQFKNKRLEQIVLKKDDPAQGRIDAITGATISSRAVAKAVRSTPYPPDQPRHGQTP
ncbi:MAG: RnfABCDGE type electron transport complex subunit G [Verrucomicrobiota bacterium]|nr:RnfABCDGE type electron transport complex subunit G [Verrucomicrobiota bacterium]